MNSEYIAIIDSGVGGLSVLKNLYNSFPNEKFLYFGDNDNAPYGNKDKKILLEITKKNIDFIKSFGVKILILGCNTLSALILDEIKEYSNILTFGVFPPVEYAIGKGKKVLLLSTVRTAERYASIDGLDTLGLIDLAKDVEKNHFFLSDIDIKNHIENLSVGHFTNQKGYYDAIILGCTHYFFVKNKIIDHFQPREIFSSEDFIVKELNKYCKLSKTIEKSRENNILFVGKNAEFNKNFSVKSGCLWENI